MEGCEDVQFTQNAIIVFLTPENILPINIKSCVQAIYGDKCVDVSTVRQFKQEVRKQVLFLKQRLKQIDIILLINSICCYIVVQSLVSCMKRLRASVMTALKRIFELECEKVKRLKKTA
jgi:ribosomal protein L23